MKYLDKVEARPYDILICNNFTLLEENIRKVYTPSQICIITDSQVAPLYLEEVQRISRGIAPSVHHIFPAGEAAKNMDTITQIYDTLIAANMDRSGLLIALGGGVVGDMAGFVAATFMRGIPFIQIPTTIVAQNDSSIGGKTGIDYLGCKNMIGAFYNPLLVYINTRTLKSLPQKELIGGLSEVIKHGLIQDAELLEYVQAHKADILLAEDEAIETMTYASCKVKCSVVENDLKEMGLRKILNFGHTIGHAIESLSQFKLSHGECVAYGSCMAAYISAERGLITKEEVERITAYYNDFGLLAPLKGYSANDIWHQMNYDKKKAHGKIAFILLEEVGKACIVTDVDYDEVAKAILFIEETCA